MIYNDLVKNSYVYHSEIVELVNLIACIFGNTPRSKCYKSYYDAGFIVNIKKKYRFLDEVINQLKISGTELLELFFDTYHDDNKTNIDYSSLPFNRFEALEDFENYVLGLKPEVFFFIFFGRYISKDKIKDALADMDALFDLYESNPNICKSFSGIKMLFDNREKFIKDYFDCAKQLNNESFKAAMKIIDYEHENQRLIKLLNDNEPLDVSQQVMGKTFHNRGPYAKFYFMPSVFVVYKAVRYFYNYQILIYSITENDISREDAINALKVMSDESRFGILELLLKNGPMIGKELADNLNIATSTLSHHIEQLKTVGFINEEKSKNSKYYSMNPNSISIILKYLQDKFIK